MKGLESWKSYQHTEDIQMERNLIVQGHLCVFVYTADKGGQHTLTQRAIKWQSERFILSCSKKQNYDQGADSGSV